MKRKRMNIVLIFIFMIGLSVMLYPSISNYWNSRIQSKAVASYQETVQSMKQEDYNQLWEEAEDYNKKLQGLERPYAEYDQIPEYPEVLNVSETGIMGYITIDKIRVELPIYHGTSEGVLQIGVGHLEGSSIPVGGKGTHCVLSGHRGLPSAKLFTNLDEMEEGDTFQITVLNRTMTYKVDQIRIIEPKEVENLAVNPEEDYCTLMTCTPYGVNSHRLLVRGVRISEKENDEVVSAGAKPINTSMVAFVIFMVTLVTGVILKVVYSHIRWRKK